MQKTRNSQIELLRIISIVMIVAHHYIFYGVEQNYNTNIANVAYSTGTVLNRCIAKMLLPGGVVGVAIFFIIAGYFGIQSEQSSLSKLIEPVAFYSVLGTILYFVLCKCGVLFSEGVMMNVVNGLFPLACETYWFASAYIIIMLTKPLLNKFIKTLNGRGVIIVLILFSTYYAVLRIPVAHYLGIVNGFEFYFIGAVLKLFEYRIKKFKYTWLFVGIMGWASYILFSNIGLTGYSKTLAGLIAICVMGLISAVGFSCFAICGRSFNNKAINNVAAATFGIYLIHEHPMLREFIWEKLFKVASVQWKSNMFFLYAAVSIGAVFVFGLLIDIVKQTVFDKPIYKMMDKVKECMIGEK